MSALSDIASLGVLGAVGFVGYEIWHNRNAISNAPGAAAQSAVNATGQGLSSIGNGVQQILGGKPYNGPTGPNGAPISSGVCADIFIWRDSLQPQTIFDSIFQTIAPPDPLSWSQFRAWEQANYGIDPGASPVDCFLQPPSNYGSPYSPNS